MPTSTNYAAEGFSSGTLRLRKRYPCGAVCASVAHSPQGRGNAPGGRFRQKLRHSGAVLPSSSDPRRALLSTTCPSVSYLRRRQPPPTTERPVSFPAPDAANFAHMAALMASETPHGDFHKTQNRPSKRATEHHAPPPAKMRSSNLRPLRDVDLLRIAHSAPTVPFRVRRLLALDPVDVRLATLHGRVHVGRGVGA